MDFTIANRGDGGDHHVNGVKPIPSFNNAESDDGNGGVDRKEGEDNAQVAKSGDWRGCHCASVSWKQPPFRKYTARFGQRKKPWRAATALLAVSTTGSA